jgi:pyruvate carboxylase
VKVTPSSKVVGDMALMMVAQGLTRAEVEDPAVDVAFPDSVIDMLKGNLGQPHGGWPKGIQAKVLKGEPALTTRPGAGVPAVDLEAVRAKVSADLNGFAVDDEDLNGYLMYPKVFLDYMGRHRMYGPVRALPTRTFFYGMQPGEEITAEIDPGKTLEIRLQAVGETTDDGEVKVFFELNGQPRVIRVPNRAIKAKTAAKPKAQEGNPNHIGAPMPGAVASVTVAVGQKVKAGDMLLTIEAMKMETGLHAASESVRGNSGSQLFSRQLARSVGVSGLEGLFSRGSIRSLHFDQREGAVCISVSNDRSFLSESSGGGHSRSGQSESELFHSLHPELCGPAQRGSQTEGNSAFAAQHRH